MPSRGDVSSASSRPWQTAIGVSSSISAANFGGFLLHSCASIIFLVFLNSTQPFLIAQLGDGKGQGTVSGNLVFADELLSLILVLVWGSLADILGTKAVAVTGYLCIAASLFAYTLASKPWPDLLFCRLAFAVGGSAVTAMLSGILNSYSASDADVQEQATSQEPDERTALLGSIGEDGAVKKPKPTHGRLAALAGLSTGCGALVAVFFLLRLPTFLAGLHDKHEKPGQGEDHHGKDVAVRKGTREAFYIVASLSIIVALTLAVMLKMDKPKQVSAEDADQNATSSSYTPRDERRYRLQMRLRRSDGSKTLLGRLVAGVMKLAEGTLVGFSLAGQEADLPLAYLGGALARACTIATTVFVPLLVVRFFYSSGQCADLPSTDLPTDELKRKCRQAFTVASILSGVIQLVALLLAPLIGWLCDVQTPARALLCSTVIGMIAFLIMGLALPNDGDPRTAPAWIAAVGIGICQIGAIVASLAQCAKAKTHLQRVASTHKVAAAEVAETAAQTGAGMSSAELQAEDEARKRRQQRGTGGVANTIRRGMSSTRSRARSGSTLPTPPRNLMRTPPAPGAIAGAYSATGGLSILIVSKAGGALSDRYAPAAFLLMAGLAAITAVAAAVVVMRETRAARRLIE